MKERMKNAEKTHWGGELQNFGELDPEIEFDKPAQSFDVFETFQM